MGGHALRFMVARPRVTRDFDFVLDVTYLRDCSTSLASVLASLGYVAIENARNFQFEKPIPNSVEVMRIEFLAPAEFARKNEIRVDVQNGVHGRACAGGSIVIVETEKHHVSGVLPDGGLAEADIQVTRSHALVMLKLLAMDERYRNVRGAAHAEHDREEAATHASDVVAILSAQTSPNDFRSRFSGQFDQDANLKERSFEIVRDYFGEPTRPGLVLYAESLIANLPFGETVRDLGTELLRAQRIVASLLLNYETA